MKIELADGYFVDEYKSQFILKKRYKGIRKGVEGEYEKIVSYHTSFEDAAKSFLSLFQPHKEDSSSIDLKGYLKAISSEYRNALESIAEAKMERFYSYIPKGNEVKEEHSIVDLIPIGRDNAISRKSLVALCVSNGLVGDVKDKDRHVRMLIEKARVDYTILNLSNGKGYYRVSVDDLQDLQRYIKQEERRAKSTFKNISMAKKLYEDYKHSRLE